MSADAEPVAVSAEALQRAEQYVEEEEGAANNWSDGSPGSFTCHLSHVTVPPVQRLCDRADANPAAAACRLRAVPLLPGLSGDAALSPSHHVVGLAGGGDGGGGRRLRDPRAATISPTATPRPNWVGPRRAPRRLRGSPRGPRPVRAVGDDLGAPAHARPRALLRPAAPHLPPRGRDRHLRPARQRLRPSKHPRGPVFEAPQSVDPPFWGARGRPDRRGDFQILFAGRPAPEKGIDVLATRPQRRPCR